MAENVIRQDVIQLDFEIDGLKEIQRLQDEINELKKKLTGGVGDEAFDDLKDSAKESVNPMKKVKDEADKVKKSVDDIGGESFDDIKDGAKESVNPMRKVKEEAEKVKKSVGDIGKKAAQTAFNGLKKLAGISFKALTAGVSAAATALGFLVKNSVQAYADYEQLVGGVETLFGAGGANSVEEYAKNVGKSVDEVKDKYNILKTAENDVIKNANNAYKTAGLSANDYMETVTGFSASLIQSLGGDTAQAVKLSDMAIIDMADNANKMGTDMSSIQYAYQGFAKQNYTMLDNLKLGYGGTKTEMERLVKDASKMKDVQKELGVTVDGTSLSYANILKAIHVVQKNMDIMGTTQKEAEGTITGSLNMVKSAWGNLMPALIQGGDSFDQCLENLVYSVDKFSDNIMPAVLKALSGVGDLIDKLVPKIEKEFPVLAEKLLPPLIRSAVSLTKGLIKALPSIIKTIATTIVDIFGEQFPIIKKIGDFFVKYAKNIGSGIVKIVPVILGLVAAFKAFKGIKSITSIFGKFGSGGAKSGSGGLFSGITETFKTLAKTKTSTILKGMANMAIIIGGFTLLTAAFMAIAPQIAQIGGAKTTLEILGLLAAVGLVAFGLSEFAGIVGKIPIMTVVKGLANMAIMIAGMSALLLVVSAVSLIDFDIKRILCVSAMLVALGVVGTALSLFAAIAGIIPIVIVLKGLANIGLAVAGMSALFLLIGAVSLLKFDYMKMLKIVGIIGVLGTVGAVLAVFAGIVGVIPIPIVLAGLANIALVLGGITALIVAFGALSEVKGFTEFIEKGGQVLVQIMNILGEMVGALAGGLIEGLSSCLPTLGENLGTFGENIKPLFSAMSGVDMGGVATFFTSLVGLLGIATGNEIVQGIKSFFGGGDESALSKLGTDLCNFATNAQGFFNTVATMNPVGFENAKLMFDSLASMKSLPKEGGVKGWFNGDINYSSIAAGLGNLSSENVINFFNTVSTLNQQGFDNATSLFDCLAGMKSLPKNGGVKGWFSGNINYSNIAAGLGALAGDGVKNFFGMVGTFTKTTFDNTKLLFETLAGIKNLPKEGGFWQDLGDKITGKETKSKLAVIADDLSNFGEKTESFFAQINNLKIGNLNGLWDSLNKAESVTDNVSKKLDENIDNMVKKVSELPVKMGKALEQSGKTLGDSFVSVWTEAVKASVKPVNKLLSGANHILKEFGSKKKVIEWQPYAKGTNGHKGGNALVNDGNGAELVQMPNGNTFVPNGRNVFIPNAPKGMKVLPAEQTANLMGKKTPTFRYEKGVGNIDIWNYIDNEKGLVDEISKTIKYDGMDGFSMNLGKSMVTTFSGEMTAWIKKLFEEEGAMSLASYVAGKGVEQWRSTVVRALKMEGQYSEANVKRTLYQMQTESGGNPRAINLWDSNAKKGIPSKGLMQCIDPTFKSYARPGFDKNIYDPLSNILASIRYAVSRYGSLAKAYRGVGYANGGLVNKTGTIAENPIHPEWVIPTDPNKRGRALNLYRQAGDSLGLSTYTPDSSVNTSGGQVTYEENNTYAPKFELTITGTNDDRKTERKVKKWVREALNETFENLSRKSPKTIEV